MERLLVANRGEIAVRILRAAAELGIRTVAVFSEDELPAPHASRADEARPLKGVGVGAYLDSDQIVALANASGCDAIHPGYGFLSESAAFARRVVSEGLTFVGPRAETLAIFGDKVQARSLAERCGVPVLKGTRAGVTLADAHEFFAALGPGGSMMVKAVAGGGGRGMRVVDRSEAIDEAYARCRSEALSAFGSGELYVEQIMPRARHIEVQIVGDGLVACALGDRECSIQRRHQKLVEIAPCPSLTALVRSRLFDDAVRLAEAVHFVNAGTFEFLMAADGDPGEARYAFIEANPRLQVEHTVTEQVLGIDLVRIQLQLAMGRTLADIGLSPTEIPKPRGYAIQVRINTETMLPDGSARPNAGVLSAFQLPTGPGVRIDTAATVGWRTNPSFDSLLAKLVVSSPSAEFRDAVDRTARALDELQIEGVATNVSFLGRILRHPEFVANRVDTGFVADHLGELVIAAAAPAPRAGPGSVGAQVDASDPLAVLRYGKAESANDRATLGLDTFDEAATLHAPMQGTIVSIAVQPGEVVRAGQPVLVMSAMKMEHVLEAPAGGVVRAITVAAGDTVPEGRALVVIDADDALQSAIATEEVPDLDRLRPDLAEVRRRHAVTLDGARPEAVARRQKTKQRTARENVADLCDPDSFVEYGALMIAAQRQRRTVEDLIERTPADGLVAGIGRVNGHLFGDANTQCAVLSYDYTVLAGTQGFHNHRKKDRMFALAERLAIPVVFFTEGGGGRPGDTDAPGVAGLDCMAFHLFAKLSGRVPLIGINSGRCFAGNAALLGCCDVVIATSNSNIGMGGPAMIEGGGLGVFRPEEVGPMSVQVPNGVVDIAVADEAAAVRAAKQYLSYFQGSLAEWECADQRRLRGIIPENRLRVYEVRSVIEALADSGSVLELRRHFGLGMVTALIRIEGRPMGVVANNPKHLAGAIDSAGADKAARFMQLCDAFDLPILFLCDTPGIMVGPEVERTALVRHCSRMFVVGANVSVPYFTIILRKAYGLGAQAMGGGSHKAPVFTVSWPTGEFGGMGLEGAVKLGFRKELAAIADADERHRVFQHMVKRAYEHGQALNAATHFEIDDVIDPADSRRWITAALRAVPPPGPRQGKKRPCIDTW